MQNLKLEQYYKLYYCWNGIEILRERGVLEKGDTVVLAGGARILQDKTENKVISYLQNNIQ